MITIVTDSSCNFTRSEAEELGVKVVPMNYSVNSKRYMEYYSDENGDFETLLRSNSKFSTSQPNLSSFLSCFEEELRLGNEVLCITISSRLSGTFSTAHMAARQTESSKIVVFDSYLTGGGLCLLIKEARKMIDDGMTKEDILLELQKVREKITIAFSVDDMTPLRKSGRIGFVRMSVGTILNVKPILLCKDGIVVADETVHGNNELIKKLVYRITPDVKEIIINHIGTNRITTNLYSIIKEKYPDIPLKLGNIGPVLGIHLGLNVIAISFIKR